VTAIASRTAESAQNAAHRWNVATAYDSYEKLLNDPDIDAVYIALPNHLHVPWSTRALESGKHVLCEKPVALNASEAQTLLDATGRSPNIKIMEAFVYRHHPQWQRAKQLITDGAIGKLRAIQTLYAYTNRDPGNIRNIAEYGGGALLDIGCYCISLSRFLFGTEPAMINGYMEIDPKFGIDRLTSGMLRFENGISLFTCATQLAFFQEVTILGTEGRIGLPTPFITPLDRPSHLFLQQKNDLEEIRFAVCNQYAVQCDAFAKAIIENMEVTTPLTDSVANMKVMDALERSARRG